MFWSSVKLLALIVTLAIILSPFHLEMKDLNTNIVHGQARVISSLTKTCLPLMEYFLLFEDRKQPIRNKTIPPQKIEQTQKSIISEQATPP